MDLIISLFFKQTYGNFIHFGTFISGGLFLFVKFGQNIGKLQPFSEMMNTDAGMRPLKD